MPDRVDTSFTNIIYTKLSTFRQGKSLEKNKYFLFDTGNSKLI